MKEQAKLAYSPLGNAFERQTKTTEIQGKALEVLKLVLKLIKLV